MDRSLDEIISERPGPRPRGAPRSEPRRPPPPPRAPRREEYPRDGVRKYRHDEPVNMNEDWVHDRYEEDRRERFDRNAYDGRGSRDERGGRNGRPEEGGNKVRVENLHYEVSERDLQELFERIGPVTDAHLVYDRMDRSTGTAYVTYKYPRDARDAITDFDGQSAKGQIIRLSLLPAGPAAPAKGGSLFDRVEPPTRTLFDRVSGGPPDARDSREDVGGQRRRPRSESPRRRTAVPEHIDRYMPGGRGSRSPIGRRGTPREGGRRPGQRREEAGGPPKGPRVPREGGEKRGKPRKTAEELDAEMADYFGGGGGAGNGDAGAAQNNDAGNTAVTDDVDMVE